MTNEHRNPPRRRLPCLAALLAVLLSFCLPAFVQAAPPLRTVLVYEGPHIDYYDILINLSRELKALGIISKSSHAYATLNGNTEELWRWLSANAGGTRLTFLSDGFYSAEYTPDKRSAVTDALRTRLATRKDVDLILAFGTWAGLEMTRLDTDVPVIVCGSTDPIGAGIVPSEKDSGKDNVVAVVETDRFLRQMDLFHQIFGFRKLGVLYTDTPAGRSCSALDQIEASCAKNGVELVRCTGNFLENLDTAQIAEQMETCHRKLAHQRVDAVYLTYNSLPAAQLPQALKPLMVAGIPLISQTGPREVQMGAMASITSYCTQEGRFAARLIVSLLNGAKPRNLPQRLHSPMLLAINMHSAARIGWNPSLEVLLIVDEFFQ
ncbi:MAG: ABC transporter substrate-binding protein [Desulfovibrio sp.]|nr:ABC transporter substrate-binding protein [Desulfovibrio sp.]